MTTYYNVTYSNQAGGAFTEEGAFVTWNAGADSGFIITDIDDGTTGKLKIAIVGSSIPPDAADTLTQGGVTADVDRSTEMLYPAYFRDDVAVAASGAVTWTGPALGVTHTIFADGATTGAIVGEILTFTNGAQCEVITAVDAVTPAVEYDVRWITNLDDTNFPTDNEAFTGNTAADGNLNGEVYARAYSVEELHRLLADLNDDGDIVGDDDLSMIDPTASARDTGQIIRLLSTITVNDTVAQHMYGGSIEQSNGDTKYSGLNIQVTSPLASTVPVVIQDDAIVTEYWDNAYMPDSIQGNIRILRKVREDGVDIDGRRIRGALFEFGQSYFLAGTTLGDGSTSLALVSANDGNNNTAVGTVAGAPYNTIVITEGYQTLDFLEGSGATPYGLSTDFGSAISLQHYERWKYIQRRSTVETLFGRNAQLAIGINLDFAFDSGSGAWTEDEEAAWGTEIPYTGGTGTLVAVGEVVEGGTSGAKGRVIYVDDTAGTGTIIVEGVENGPFGNTEALTTVRGASEWTATSGTVVTNANAGTGIVIAANGTTTGNLWMQQTSGLVPLDNQTIFGDTSGQTADVNEPLGVNTRTINNQFIGVYTGTNYQPNFGIAIDPSDSIAGDSFFNLNGTQIFAPDIRNGTVTNLLADGGDTVTVFPWDGVTNDINGDPEPNFNEMALTVALIAATSTTLEVGASNIPDNTPANGFLRVERDSDNNLDLIEYSSYVSATGVFTLVGTAPSNAAISNTVMRALIDKVATATSESYTALFNSTEDVAITVRRGGGPNPIKTFKTTAQFGSFSTPATRTPD